ncbi:hypothetical protein T484DRAFT_1865237 [Baffinella frigidus]|nr:hypothetical protein T484DRAFT_1865237 [Cryptophyta sp. CCMP2293]
MEEEGGRRDAAHDLILLTPVDYGANGSWRTVLARGLATSATEASSQGDGDEHDQTMQGSVKPSRTIEARPGVGRVQSESLRAPSSRCARVAEEAGGVAISGSQRCDDIQREIATAEDELSNLSDLGPDHLTPWAGPRGGWRGGQAEARSLVQQRITTLRVEETVLARAEAKQRTVALRAEETVLAQEAEGEASGAGDLSGEIEIGTEISVLVEGGKWYNGVVEKGSKIEGKYTVLFSDGDRQTIRIPDPDVKILRVLPGGARDTNAVPGVALTPEPVKERDGGDSVPEPGSSWRQTSGKP